MTGQENPAPHPFDPTDDGVGGLRCGHPTSEDNPLPCWEPADHSIHAEWQREGGQENP